MPFERELAFTEAYRAHQNDPPAVREYECLKVQIPQSFRPLKNIDTDLFEGRIEDALIGFHPIFAGNDEIDKVAYCIREDRCDALLQKMEEEGTYSAEYLGRVRGMLAFWKRENTVSKVQARMTGEMRRSMTGVNFKTESGAAYPLYRIAGVNLDARKLFRLGLPGLIDEIKEKAARPGFEASRPLYDAMAGVLEILRDVCALYAQELDGHAKTCASPARQRELSIMRDSLLHIRDAAPATLHEAIQLLILYMLASGSREIGRLDDFLGDFYMRDLAAGVITRPLAVRMVVNFFDIIEEEFARDTRAIIGGVGRHNVKAADEFALVVLDALDERPFGWQPQVSLRWYRDLDARIYDRALEILGKGRTFPLLYNDEVNVPAVMRAMDVSRNIAEQYSFFGCGEYMIAGKSIGTPNALINVAKALEVTLYNGVDPVTGKEIGLKTGEITDDLNFEEIFSRFSAQIAYFADLCGSFKELVYDVCNEESAFLLVSILTDDCIDRGRAVFDGGIWHLGGTVETYGNITTADSLAALKEIACEQKKLPLTALVNMLDADFEGYEAERQLLLNAHKYGNDCDAADQVAVRMHELVCNAVRRQKDRTRLDSLLVVVINNNANVCIGENTGATPDGRKKGVFLSNGNAAYNGRDHEGVTALMKSMTKLESSIHAGASHNFKFSPALFRGDAAGIKGLLAGFFALGGQQANISVVDQRDLEDAMLHPENHENLIVRVGGYTARFVSLDEHTQRDVLSRTAY